MVNEKVLVLDFGGQYNQLIARRVRELNVYCEMHPCTMSLDKIREMAPKAIIFTGGPSSVFNDGAPHVDKGIFELGIPVLGICYGCQLIAYTLGGKVEHAETREYGRQDAVYDKGCPLFKGLEDGICWMSHTDRVEALPEGFKVVAHTDTCKIAAFADDKRKIYGVQYHPEVHHTQRGIDQLRNFLYEVAGVKGDWTMGNFAKRSRSSVRWAS